MSSSFESANGSIRLFGMVLLALAFAFVTLMPRAAHADVPGRVGRIASMQGDVQAYSEADPQWKVAYLNEPITSRNSVFVGDAGRVEINIGSTTLAMGAGSQIDIQQLDDNAFDATVVRGQVSVLVRRFDAGDAYNIASPDADFALLRPGRYRIDAMEASSGLSVFAGQASTQGDRGVASIDAGTALRVAANPSNPNGPPELQPIALSPSGLDNWLAEREARFQNSQSERYVSQNMTGYEDLDANGRWASEPDVGPVWYPTTYVQQDWAPYRYGRWAYVAPWGYTWIDDAPWGFAPFHYGRWIEVGGRWGWCPGAYVARPVYAPALVGFYGGNGFSASFSVGAGPAVGWYPLAPWQRYSPHYTQNATYINQVNNIAVVQAPRRFAGDSGGRDWNRDHGATIVPRDAFASQRSISRVATAAPRELFDRAGRVNAAELPRPDAVPGAVRRGPSAGDGSPRPDFRSSPRDFANRNVPNDGPSRGVGAVVPQQDNPRAFDRTRPSVDPRVSEGSRPAVEASRPDQPRRYFPTQAGPNAPAFNRDVNRDVNRDANRDVRQYPVPGSPAGEGQGFATVPSPRQDARVQAPTAPVRTDGDARQPEQDRAFRALRTAQPPAAGSDRQQMFERPQRFERPAPVAPAPATPAPAQPSVQPNVNPRQQGVERQGFERPQRVERPAQAPPTPQAAPPAAVAPPRPAPAAPAAPAPQAPHGQPPAGPPARNGEPGFGQPRG